MNNINEIKPLKEEKGENIWNKIKKGSAILTTVAIMTTVGCSTKSEIEWVNKNEKKDDTEFIDGEIDDEIIDSEEEDGEVFDDEISDSEEKEEEEDLIDSEEQDEDFIDSEEKEEEEDLIDTEEMEEEEDLIDTEKEDEDVLETEIPETIVTLKLNINEDVQRIVAGEKISIDGKEYDVKYDNNDGSIYLIKDDEINRIEWEKSVKVNDKDVRVNDIWVNKTAFETRMLYKVTDVNTNEVQWTAIGEKDTSIIAKIEDGKFNYVALETLENEDWDSGSRTIISFEANVNGVETKHDNFIIVENEGKQVGNYYIESKYSKNLYDGMNVKCTFTIGNEICTIKEGEQCSIEGNLIEIDKPFYDELEGKWWTKVYVNSEFVKTIDEGHENEYNGILVKFLGAEFI